jgi:hypothetical protein
MLEKIGQSAEKVVNKLSLSRRGFLGRVAKAAARLGAVAAGLTAFPRQAGAAFRWCPRGTKGYCCGYSGCRPANSPEKCSFREYFACM